MRGADLSAQASGVVDEISFESGNEVPAGKVLLRLKPNDDYAKLQQLQAAAELAEQTYKRDQEQFAAQAISQANIDTDVSTLKSARAQVAAQQALIEEKIVKAPFAGRLGIRQVDIGQYLTAGTAVVTLQALDPILVDFYVPQQALAQMKIGQAGCRRRSTPTRSRHLAVRSRRSTPRSIQAAAMSKCVRRCTIRIGAWSRECSPMYALQYGEKSDQITLPQTVVTYNPFGDTVYIVRERRRRRQGQSAPDRAAALRQS